MCYSIYVKYIHSAECTNLGAVFWIHLPRVCVAILCVLYHIDSDSVGNAAHRCNTYIYARRENEGEKIAVMQALGCIPPQSVSAIVTSGPSGTLWSPRCLRGAAVAQFSMLRLPAWITEAWLKTFSQRLDLVHSDLPLAQSEKLLAVLPCHPGLRSLHLSCKSHCMHGSLAFLSGLQHQLSSLQLRLPNLTVLNLHSLSIGEEHVCLLSGIFNVLKGHLMGLGLTLHPDCTKSFAADVQGKLRFFTAIAKLSKLRVLLLPQWNKIVRKNVSVLTPLKKLSRLTVLVHQDLKTSLIDPAVSVMPGLEFTVVPELSLIHI